MKCSLYVIINKTDNSIIYAGQTQNPVKRFRLHKSGAFNPNSTRRNQPLYRHIRQFSTPANFDVVFELKVVEELESRSNEKENKLIIRLREAGHSLLNIYSPTRYVGDKIVCSHCKLSKPKLAFYKHHLHGFQDRCKNCNSLRSRKNNKNGIQDES